MATGTSEGALIVPVANRMSGRCRSACVVHCDDLGPKVLLVVLNQDLTNCFPNQLGRPSAILQTSHLHIKNFSCLPACYWVKLSPRMENSLVSLTIQDCLLKIEKRAERAGDEKLLETFVDAAPLLASIDTTDHQVIFGRRGTGKTHVLKYIQDSKRATGDIAIYLDLRMIGSNGSIYNDREKTHPQRATPLLLDVLAAMHDALVETAVQMAEQYDLSVLGPKLDALADAISNVEVVGSVEVVDEFTNSAERTQSSGVSASLTNTSQSATINASDSSKDASSQRALRKSTGQQRYYVRFGSVQFALGSILDSFGPKRVWLLLDEWSEIPLDLQPYLADLLRRCVLPNGKVTVKIAAIEHRSNFSQRNVGEYLGIELGADMGADVNLDDFMVFDNDASRAKSFFADLLFKHYRATDGLDPSDGAQTSDDLISQSFTQVNAFEELVRAVEGVPRDAVYLIANAVRKAYGRKISVNDVRDAAREWYQRDKSSVLRSNEEMSALMQWIIDEVIAHRRARAFLFNANQRNNIIDALFDSRLLHVRKRSISSNDTPGVRYDVYKLDYGCYVDLIATTRAPVGLLPSGENGEDYIDVPPDDYRSIRRAILSLDKFLEARNLQLSAQGSPSGEIA